MGAFGRLNPRSKASIHFHPKPTSHSLTLTFGECTGRPTFLIFLLVSPLSPPRPNINRFTVATIFDFHIYVYINLSIAMDSNGIGLQDFRRDVRRDVRRLRPRVRPASPEPTTDQRLYQGTKWVLICMSLYIPAFLYGLDTTIAADIQGPVVQELGHVEQFSWIGTGFPLGSLCVVLLLGPLLDNFNMKYIYLASVALYEVGSALCGGAPNMSAFIIGRVIAGVGGSGIYLGSLQYLNIMTTRNERELYMSLIVVFWGVGCVAGPVVGGAFAVSAGTWRWAFYIKIVIGAVCVPGFLLALPSICLVNGINGITVRSKLSSIDFLGFFLGSVMWVSFLLAITMAGGQWPWNDGRTIAIILVFVLSLALYVLQQYYAAFTPPTSRAFPGRLLRDYTQVLLFVATAAGTSATFVMTYYLPIYFQFVDDDTAFAAGLRLFPFIIFAIIMSLSSSGLLQFIRAYKFQFIIASVCLVLGGGGLFHYLEPSTPMGTIHGFSIFIALGCGFSMVSGYTVSAVTVEPEDTGAGLTFQTVAQIGAEVISLGMAGQIYRSCAIANLRSVLADHGYSDAEILGALSGVKSDLFRGLEGELRDEAIGAITKAMQMTFVLVPVAGGMMFLAALAMKYEKVFDDPSDLLFAR